MAVFRAGSGVSGGQIRLVGAPFVPIFQVTRLVQTSDFCSKRRPRERISGASGRSATGVSRSQDLTGSGRSRPAMVQSLHRRNWTAGATKMNNCPFFCDQRRVEDAEKIDAPHIRRGLMRLPGKEKPPALRTGVDRVGIAAPVSLTSKDD